MTDVGAPAVDPFCQLSTRLEPSADPSRLMGADGGSGTLTKIRTSFDAGLRETVEWYTTNAQWWQRVENEAYRTANAMYLGGGDQRVNTPC